MQKNTPGTVKFKYHLFILVIIGFIMIIEGFFIAYKIRDFYHSQMHQESQRITRSYTVSLEAAIDASDIINNLLEEKILAASLAAATLNNPNDNQILNDLANAMGVDEIYIYNTNGVIVNSSSGKYMGWKAYEGHPVYGFMTGEDTILIEEIRKDSESEIYYKYGYYALENGSFVQVGVLAEKIRSFLDAFEMKYLLTELSLDGYNADTFFVNEEYAIISSDRNYYKDFNLSPEMKAATATNKEWSDSVIYNGKSYYQVIMPVYVDNQKAGSLIMLHDMTHTEKLIRTITRIEVLALAFLFILVFIIITSNYRKRKHLEHYAFHDLLTDFPNKRFFEYVITRDNLHAQHDKRAVIMITYRNLLSLNLTYGYQQSELVMKDLANSLRVLCNESTQLFHISNDRFAFYVSSYGGKNELVELSNAIIHILKSTITPRAIWSAIGVVEIMGDNHGPDHLLKYAAIAADCVGDSVSYGYCFFSDDMKESLQRENQIEKEMNEIIQSGNQKGLLTLEFQPILNLRSNQVNAFEALARLKSPTFGQVSPNEFIPIAENSQLIVPLGRLIFRAAVHFLNALEIHGYENIIIFINVSPIQLLSENFITDIRSILLESRVKTSSIGLELTESIFSDNYSAINDKISLLKEMGIKVAIDDFGTGYSSLARERELNIDYLKIDKSFIDNLLSPSRNESITGDIISMAHKMGHQVTAEGVEYACQKDYLLAKGCDNVQGYWFSHPLTEEFALEFLGSNNSPQNKGSSQQFE